MKISDFITKDRLCVFKYYRQKHLYYTVDSINGEKFMFPVPIDDLGEATVNQSEKAITMMRYIRKSLSDGSLVKDYQ